jgi:3-oxoadipate enol-lactonase
VFSAQTRTAVAELAAAVLSLRPLIDRLDQPITVTAADGHGIPDGHGVQRVLDRVAGRLGAPRFRMVQGGGFHDLGTFGATVSRRLDLDASAAALAVAADELPAVDRVVDSSATEDFEAFCEQVIVQGPDSARLRAYAAGDPGRPAVVIASACGMPARLAEAWIRRLAVDHYVLTWESRGLFGDVDSDCDDFDGATDVAAQAGDLIALLDHFGVASAHVAGLCGGAVIALTAAADRPDRVSSLSLWHGDFELGDDRLKTDHQRNLQALMTMATQARVSATGVHAVLCQSIAQSSPPDLAHLVLYPYATAGLLFRYCQLNGAIMDADLRGRLHSIIQPTLVVTSEDDVTAHPAGSRYVAAALPNARLHVAPHGDHLSLFRGPPDLLAAASHLMAGPNT